MNRISISSILVATMLPTWSYAADDHNLSLTTYLASDYMFRGVSQTDNGATLQLGIDYAHSSGLLAGLFFSNVDYDSDTRREEDVYIGYTHDFNNGVGIDLQAWYYTYHNENVLNYPEYMLGIRYKWFDAKYWYSDDYSGTGGDQHYYEAGASIPLNDDFSLGLRAGHTEFDRRTGLDDYSDYSISLSTSWQGFDMALTATDTNDNQFGNLEDSRLIFSLSKTFSFLP